jgi:type IV secretory pathway TraG/TraD family ATPase VirD4
MIYWLFTDGKEIAGSLLLPLLCTAPLLLFITAVSLGTSIRRTGEAYLKLSSIERTLVLVSYIVSILTTSTLYLNLFANRAIERGRSNGSDLVSVWVGAPYGIDSARLLQFALVLVMVVIFTVIALHSQLKNGSWLREKIDRLRSPNVRRGALGSSHFCTSREYRRFRRPDPDGLILLGAFWGEGKQRLDMGIGQFCLGAEDVARGVLALGGPGSGKTQGIILPTIADRMFAGHSLVVADPQGEITAHVLQYASITRHLVVIHDPTSVDGPRYNVAQDIDNVSDARAIADVLIPSAPGDNRFWTDSASALLAACLMRFDNLGDIYSAINDTKSLANTLKSKKDDAALLANSFVASVASDGKVASNIIATLATALTGWASQQVRANTSKSDFDADLIVDQPTIVVLTCPGRMRGVYASYLGATLRKLMLDLDTIGEHNNGPLPTPVAIILDEFPTLGRLDNLVSDVNLVRKRRISILIGAQTKGQFEMIYGREGTQALFTGLATQIVYGGCDADTADFYSKASGIATTDANTDDPNSHLRQRALLTIDEIITPQIGNCTVFARYVETGFATQVILNARLTRFYERLDWKQRLTDTHNGGMLLLERGVELHESEQVSSADAAEASQAANLANIEVAARKKLAEIKAKADESESGNVKFTSIADLRNRYKKSQRDRIP